MDWGLDFEDPDIYLLIYLLPYLNQFSVALAVCFGLLVCWKVDLCACLKCLADWNKFSSRIPLNLATVLLPSTLTSFPVSANKKTLSQHDATTTILHCMGGVLRVHTDSSH